jgi:UDP-2,3-diacylglucosamine pyrophosphatase LpxH
VAAVLIVVSDLHLMDGTAGVHQLGAEAFRRVFRDLAHRAREARAQDLKIVLLGDILDLIRTAHWFSYAGDLRPWGTQRSEEAIVEVFDGVVAKNREVLDIFSGSLVDQFDFPVEPERVFVPGNHDRLCNLFPSLRRKVRKLLAIPGDDERFDHTFLDLDHAVFARHGQEWDPFNFEDSEAFSVATMAAIPWDDYMKTPIGDLIASEFAAKLPSAILEHLREGPERDRIVRKFQDLFDVRPLIAIIQWLSYRATHQEQSVQAWLNEAIRQVTEEFEQIPYVRGWIERHDRAHNPFDEADRLELLMNMLETLRFSQFQHGLTWVERAEEQHDARYANRAAQDIVRLDRDPELRHRILYILYGHTHQPDQRALGVVGDGADERERIYVNTGTWRPVHRRSLTGQGFVSWKNVTYTLVYRPGELIWGDHKVKVPVFETWSGSINDTEPWFPGDDS